MSAVYSPERSLKFTKIDLALTSIIKSNSMIKGVWFYVHIPSYESTKNLVFLKVCSRYSRSQRGYEFAETWPKGEWPEVNSQHISPFQTAELCSTVQRVTKIG